MYVLDRKFNKEKHELKIQNPIEKKTVEELKNKVIQGDCLDIMQAIPDEYNIILCDKIINNEKIF
jgi:DNA modification methylase